MERSRYSVKRWDGSWGIWDSEEGLFAPCYSRELALECLKENPGYRKPEDLTYAPPDKAARMYFMWEPRGGGEATAEFDTPNEVQIPNGGKGWSQPKDGLAVEPQEIRRRVYPAGVRPIHLTLGMPVHVVRDTGDAGSAGLYGVRFTGVVVSINEFSGEVILKREHSQVVQRQDNGF